LKKPAATNPASAPTGTDDQQLARAVDNLDRFETRGRQRLNRSPDCASHGVVHRTDHSRASLPAQLNRETPLPGGTSVELRRIELLTSSMPSSRSLYQNGPVGPLTAGHSVAVGPIRAVEYRSVHECCSPGCSLAHFSGPQ